MCFAAEHKTLAFLNMKYLLFKPNLVTTVDFWINLSEVLHMAALYFQVFFSFYADLFLFSLSVLRFI